MLRYKEKMSSEYIPVHVVDDTEKEEEIQLAEISESREETSHDPTEVVTIEISLVELAGELKDVKAKKKGIGDRKIQRVPEIMLRKGDFKKYFKPKELSIGPIHAADHNLFKKEIKLKLAARFIEESGRTVDALIEEFKLKVNNIKNYFDEEVIEFYTDEELISLVFFDGCAMLEFIDSYVNQRLNLFNIGNGQAALIRQDLFLLENQIPFDVLLVLMRFRRSDNYLINDFLTFITMDSVLPINSTEFYEMKNKFFGLRILEKRDHFLDLHQRMLLTSSRHFTFGMTSNYAVMNHLKPSYYAPQYSSIKQIFPNVQELKVAGIEFKPTDSLSTISFGSGFIRSQLLLPTLVVDDSTECMLLNLIAYELFIPRTDVRNGSLVTSYINLLDSLVDNEQDVKDLSAANIIRNYLSTDSEVVRLIKKIGSSCVAPPTDAYQSVKEKIENHCRNKSTICIAQLRHKYFRSPLIIVIVLLVSMVLLYMSIQTWFTINSQG